MPTPLKLFISYRRQTWPFTGRLAERIRAHTDWNIFVDYEGIHEADFERAILANIRDCDCFLLVVSPETFNPERIHRPEDWVRREIGEALETKRPITLALIDGLAPPPASELPPDIQEVTRRQGVNFYPDYFEPAVTRLVDFIGQITQVPVKQPTHLPSPDIDPVRALDDAVSVLEADPNKAVFLLEYLLEIGYHPPGLDLEPYVQLARDLAGRQQSYRALVTLAKSPLTRKQACEDFARFREHCPDYDPDDLASQCQEVLRSPASVPRTVPARVGGPYPPPDHDQPPRDPGALEDDFLRLYFESEAAEASGDRSAALQYAEELYELLVNNWNFFGARQQYAPMVGNAAITAERFKANDLATRLYKLALEIDPEHSNNIQNYVDFIVQAPMPDLYDEAREYMEKLKTGKHASHRLERTRALEARFASLTGATFEVDPETVEETIARFADNPSDTRKFVATMVFLDQIGDLDSARRVARMYYDVATTDEARYTAVRGLADMLAASPDERNEREAMDMYRHILESSIGESPEAVANLADMLHNYATLLYKHDYDDEAGRVWYESYRLQPAKSPIRRAYGFYLLRARRPDLARLVGEGQPIDEMVLQPCQKELPDRFLDDDDDVDRWWEL